MRRLRRAAERARRGRRAGVVAVAVLAAVVALAAVAARRGDGPTRPADVFAEELARDPAHASALRTKRYPVPDLVGRPLDDAEAFVRTVPRARLTVGGAGPVILFQQPPSGGLLADDGSYLAVTLGTEADLDAVRNPSGAAAEGLAEAATREYPTPTSAATRPRPAGPAQEEVRDPADVDVEPPGEYTSVVVVVTYAARPADDGTWRWILTDGTTAAPIGSFAVAPGHGCGDSARQRLAVPLARPVPPEHEVTLRLVRRVGPSDEHVTASSFPVAMSYRGSGIVLFDNGGRLATNPTGEATC